MDVVPGGAPRRSTRALRPAPCRYPPVSVGEPPRRKRRLVAPRGVSDAPSSSSTGGQCVDDGPPVEARVPSSISSRSSTAVPSTLPGSQRVSPASVSNAARHDQPGRSLDIADAHGEQSWSAAPPPWPTPASADGVGRRASGGDSPPYTRGSSGGFQSSDASEVLAVGASGGSDYIVEGSRGALKFGASSVGRAAVGEAVVSSGNDGSSSNV